MDAAKLNQLQSQALGQFRSAVEDCKLQCSTDAFLLRWLIARDFDEAKAEKMLRASVKWRYENRIDALPTDYRAPEVLKKFYAAGRVGVDKIGNPLWIVRYGRIDMKGLLQSAKRKDFYSHAISMIEGNAQFCNNSPSTLTQTTTIFDMENFSIRQLGCKQYVEMTIQIVKTFEANYPEYVHRIFVINAPDFFAMAFAVIRPILSEKTAKKIRVFGSNEASQWKKAFLEEIDSHQLPVHYGGTMVDPDGNPQCLTKVNMGGTIPKSYYFSNQPKSESVNGKSLAVPNRSKQQLEFQVSIPGSTLRWEFYCEEGDIDFAIYLKNDSGNSTVVPKDRVDCHIAPEAGEIRADPDVVEFDNSFSFLRSKVIRYSITVDQR